MTKLCERNTKFCVESLYSTYISGAEVETYIGGAEVETYIGGAEVETYIGGAEVETYIGGAEVETYIGGAEVETYISGAEVESLASDLISHVLAVHTPVASTKRKNANSSQEKQMGKIQISVFR